MINLRCNICAHIWKTKRKGIPKRCPSCYSSLYNRLALKTGPAFKYGVRTSNIPEYKVWAGMKNRCYLPTLSAYPLYGGRGIKVCDEWLNDFAAFYSYVGPRPTPQHSIDRIDSNGHYEPGNVRWSTDTEQNRNTSFNRLSTINGVTKTTVEWAESLGMDVRIVYSRMRRGKTIENSLHTPVKRRKH